ncbi:MAG: hypothetical protein AAFX93_11805 [Verrucomicrobiota bacterium]
MRKFIWEVIKFSSVQFVLLATFLTVFFGIPEKYHYLAAAEDKKYRFDHAEGPRLILIGDSGVAYGMDSSILAEEFPDYTVINMALMAGLGFRNILAEVEDDLRPGDVVVVIFAHQLFDRNILHHQYWNYLTYRPDMFVKLDWRDWPVLMDNAGFLAQRGLKVYKRVMTWKVHPDRPGPVNRAGFNEYGDLVAHHGATTLPTINYPMNDLNLEKEWFSKLVVKEMNAFARKADAAGAEVFYMFPAIPESSWAEGKERILKSEQYAVEGFEFPILNNAEEMVYPDDDFYDTNYHLLGPAAKRRTELLAERLKSKIGREE